jgi:hypothetical protein
LTDCLTINCPQNPPHIITPTCTCILERHKKWPSRVAQNDAPPSLFALLTALVVVLVVIVVVLVVSSSVFVVVVGA